MRRRKKSEDRGFNVWRSYSDMMAGVLLLFVLIMCVTLFQAQKSYNESVQERDVATKAGPVTLICSAPDKGVGPR